jgi:hypothetical protein
MAQRQTLVEALKTFALKRFVINIFELHHTWNQMEAYMTK